MEAHDTLLHALLPDTQPGFRCLGLRPKGKPYWNHKFYPTTAELIRAAKELDAKGAGDVYHACAIYDPTEVKRIQDEDKANTGRAWSHKGRSAEAASCANALWVDVDVKPDKADSYPDKQTALDAIKQFSQSFATPSFIVASGGGYHLYWVLEQPIDVPTWRGLAERLKAKCKQEGFLADPVRTSDIASVLRPPGTHNRKREPAVMVKARDTNIRYPQDQLAALLQHVEVQPPVLVGQPTTENDDLINGVRPPSNIRGVLAGCQQIRTSALTKGANDSEPFWLAVLRTVAKCDGMNDGWMHKISSGHPGYTPASAQAKIDHAKTMDVATCESFDEHNPGGCTGCPHRGQIKSPIRLGEPKYMEQEKSVTVPTASSIVEFCVPEPKEHDHYRFDIDADGPAIRYQTRVKDDEGNWVWTPWARMSDVLYQPIRREWNNILGEMVGVYQFKFPKDAPVVTSVPMEKLTESKGVFQFLGKKGLVVDTQDKRLRAAHLAYNNAWWIKLQEKASNVVTDRFGWVKDTDENLRAFVAGKQYNMDGTTAKPSLTGKARSEGEYVKVRGSLDEWKRVAMMFCRPGLEVQQMLILLSTFGPFIAATNYKYNPAVISLVSMEPAQGKTTAAALALSVWSDPTHMLSGDATYVGMLGVLEARNNLTVVLDEMTTAKPSVAADFIYAAVNGHAKTKGTQDNDIVVPRRFNMPVITTSNQRMRAKIEEHLDALQGAAQTRIIEIEMQSNPDLKAALLTSDPLSTINTNYGVAGDWWASYMLGCDGTGNKIAQFAQEFHAETMRLRTVLAEPDIDRFPATAIAAVLVAADYMERTGFLPITRKQMEAFLFGTLMPDHVNQREATKVDPLTVLAQLLHEDMTQVVETSVIRPMETVTVDNVTHVRRQLTEPVEYAAVSPDPERFRGKQVVARWETFFNRMNRNPVTTQCEQRLLVSRTWLKQRLTDRRYDFASFLQAASAAGMWVTYDGQDNMSPPKATKEKHRALFALSRGYVANAPYIDVLAFDPTKSPALSGAAYEIETRAKNVIEKASKSA